MMGIFRKKEPKSEIHIHVHDDGELAQTVIEGEEKHQEILDRAASILERLEVAVEKIETGAE